MSDRMQIQIPNRPMTPDNSRSPSPSPLPSPTGHGTLYFGYGSNMWQHQMASRCPTAKYLGVGRLRHWRWQINTRGCANIVEAPPPPYSPATCRWLGPLMGSDDLREDNDRTFGFVYQLTPEDEAALDRFEDVAGGSYSKEEVYVEFWAKPGNGDKVKVNQRTKKARAMVYVDRLRTADGKITGGYTDKMNEGLQDAVGEGIPQSYIDECIRPYVPVLEPETLTNLAIEDAMRRGIDVKKFIEETERRMATTGAREEGEVHNATNVSQDLLNKYLQTAQAEGTNQKQMVVELRRRRALSLV